MIYLDHAATSLQKPPVVADAVARALTSLGNAQRGAHEASLATSRLLYETRGVLATLFHADDATRVSFTSGVTESLNTAIKGVLDPPCHVVTTVAEHNSVLRPLYEMEQRGVSLSFCPVDDRGRILYEEMERLVRDDTVAVIVTAASNVTGNLTDLKTVSAIAHAHGALLIVDAAQAAGVADLDVLRDEIDIFCFTGHKGLYGPQGTGGLVVRKGVSVRPLKTGGSGTQSFSRAHPDRMPEALEAGTLNGHGIAGLHASVRWIQEQTREEIAARERTLANRFYEGVREIHGIRFYGDMEAKDRMPIVSLNIGDEDAAFLADTLSEAYDIAVRAGAHCAPLLHTHFQTRDRGIVRFSFSFFNTEEEADTAAAALREIAKEIL